MLLAPVFVLPAAVRSVKIVGPQGSSPLGLATFALPRKGACHRLSRRQRFGEGPSELPAEVALDRFSLPSPAQERYRVKRLQAVKHNAEAPAECDPAEKVGLDAGSELADVPRGGTRQNLGRSR